MQLVSLHIPYLIILLIFSAFKFTPLMTELLKRNCWHLGIEDRAQFLTRRKRELCTLAHVIHTVPPSPDNRNDLLNMYAHREKNDFLVWESRQYQKNMTKQVSKESIHFTLKFPSLVALYRFKPKGKKYCYTHTVIPFICLLFIMKTISMPPHPCNNLNYTI